MTDGAVGTARPDRRERRATIRDVAEAAGVSRSTASRALTGSGYVGRGVRERVELAAEALGYVPDAMARHLKQQVSRSIGVLVPDLRSAFYADVVAGVTREARHRGYATILTGDLAEGADAVQVAERFVALRVAGVVVVPVSSEVSAYLARRRTPVVEVGPGAGPGPAGGLATGEARLARDLTDHLLGLGHRRVALLVDRLEWATGRARRDGFLAACRQSGLDPEDPPRPDHAQSDDTAPGDVTAPDDVTAQDGGTADDGGARPVVVAVAAHDDADDVATRLLAGPRAPTAVVAASERLAAATWRAARHLGLLVPADLSMVSVDDAPWMGMVTPPVTAGERDGVALGVAAVDRLLGHGGDGPPDTATRVLHRGSTAPPPGAAAPGADPGVTRTRAVQS